MIESDVLQKRATKYVLEDLGLTTEEFNMLDSDTKNNIGDYIFETIDDMRFNQMKYFRPLEYQKEFFKLQHRRKGLIAANRSGKTVSTCMEFAYHLTGLYPDWWEGRRFDSAIQAIAAGESWQQVMKSIGNEIIGTSDAAASREIGSGSIPKNTIDFNTLRRQGETMKAMRVKHVCGEYSVFHFANYSQNDKNLQGFKAHLVLIDEQPPEKIYNELAMRTMTTDGTVLCSFTPLKGFTPLVENFWQYKPGFGHIRVRWDDVPEHDPWGLPLFLNSTRELMMSELPAWEIGPRTQGLPMQGVGTIFNVHPLPTYQDGDYDLTDGTYDRVISIDLASVVDKTVITVMYWDKTNKTGYIDTQYVFESGEESKYSNWKNYLTNPKYKGTPIVLPTDASQKNRYTESASSIRELLLAEGLNVYGTSISSKFKVEKGETNTISYGISKMNAMMTNGTLFINKKCKQLLKDMDSYHLDAKGNYRGHDDTIDSARYALLGCLMSVAKPLHYSKEANDRAFRESLAFSQQQKINKKPSYRRPVWIQ